MIKNIIKKQKASNQISNNLYVDLDYENIDNSNSSIINKKKYLEFYPCLSQISYSNDKQKYEKFF